MDAAQLQIVIDIEAKLDALLKVQTGMRDARKETESFSELLKTGLGIGSGMEIARRGIEMFKESVLDGLRSAIEMAKQIDGMSRSLGISTDAYQVLTNTIEGAGGNADALTQAINAQTQSMANARDVTSSAAQAYRTLGLSVSALETMSVEQRIEAIAKASANASDKTGAFRANAELLGTRTIPQLQAAMKELGEKGYDTLATEQTKAGLVMDSAIVKTLALMDRHMEELKKKAKVVAGGAEFLGFTTLEALLADPVGTMSDLFMEHSSPGSSGLATRLAQFLPKDDSNGNNNATITPLQQSPEWLKQTLELQKEQYRQSENQADASLGESHQRGAMITLLNEEYSIRSKLLKLAQDDLTLDPATRAALIAKIEAENRITVLKKQGLQNPPSEYSRISDAYGLLKRGEDNQGGKSLTAGQGFVGGLAQWAIATGTYGQQIAGTLQGTIGNAVSNLSSGIFGLITHTKTLGDVARDMGSMFVQALIEMIVRAIAFAAIIFTLNLIAPGLGSAVAASYSAASGGGGGGGVAGIGMGLATGRASGGAVSAGQALVVGDGGRPELFVPHTAGRIVPSLDNYRSLTPGFGASGGVSQSKQSVYILKPANDEEFRQMVRNPNWDAKVVDTMMRNRGALLNG